MRNPALVLVILSVGCGETAGRLRFVSSQATQASWSFVIDDRARGAEVLVDGRFRGDGCARAGSQIRCELRGMFPGGHTVDVRLPAADLRRTVLIGHPWPARPILVAARDADEAAAAAKAGADGVLVDANAFDPTEIVEAAHKQGARAIVRGQPELVETAGADGALGALLPADLARRFPEARSFAFDEEASRAIDKFAGGGDAAELARALAGAKGLVSAKGLVGDAAALAAPSGAVVDRAALPLLEGRRRHAALREGKLQDQKMEGPRLAVTWVAGNDSATLLVNAGAEPWQVTPELPSSPLDLLGGHPSDDGKFTVGPRDVALLVRLPAKDRTKY